MAGGKHREEDAPRGVQRGPVRGVVTAAGARRASVCRARQARPGPESAARAPSSLTSRRAAQGIFPGPRECPRRPLFPVILGG